jgi:hypothetical protein
MATMQPPFHTAPLAGVSSGLQAHGVWAGRRQLFVRFAGEAETATMYRADALAREMQRLLSRSTYHSIAISGRDALGCADFLAAALQQVQNPVSVMVDTDGDKAAALAQLQPFLKMVQVTIDAPLRPGAMDRALEGLRMAARLGCEHALVIVARDEASDAQLLQIVEQAHAASAGTIIVIHPGPVPGERTTLDRRWSTIVEQAAAVHPDVHLALRLPGPAALR